ncbi:perlucin-like [Mytilus trossulus]|uniref:perlucin-like n=1 Tax=Mytilus trossulus TaxID=6551 RepID=UPI0030050FA6
MDGVWKNYDESNLAFYDYMYNYTLYGSWNDRDALAIISTDNLLWWERNEYETTLKMLCERDIVDSYWVGGSDQMNEGIWLWEDGQTINMSLFRTGEPNGNSAQNCLSLKFSASGNLFEDEDCSIPKKFICQRI